MSESQLLHEFRETLHRLWGKWKENTPYDESIKDDLGKLQAIAHKMDEQTRRRVNAICDAAIAQRGLR
jgi:hypothetical protein